MFRERWLKWGKIVVAFIFALMLMIGTKGVAYAGYSAPPNYFGDNPSSAYIKGLLIAAGQRYHIPPQILFGIAYAESHWQQYGFLTDVPRRTTYHLEPDGRVGVGIMQITVSPTDPDYARLCTDIPYNIDRGAQILISKWNSTPVIGDGLYENGREKLENWYYAIWAYNGFTCPNPNNYAPVVLQHIANGEGLWDPVAITSPPNAGTCPPPTIPTTPSPTHIDANFDGVIDGDNPGGNPGCTGFDGFDYPFGDKSDTNGWHDAQGYEAYYSAMGGYHPGEDWNKDGGSTADIGEPVYAIGYGVVKRIDDVYPGNSSYGKFIVIKHNTPNGVRYSDYLHVGNISVHVGDTVTRGQKIAEIADISASGLSPHLHLEIRGSASNDGAGSLYPNDNGNGYYSTKAALEGDGFLAPSAEIEAQRPSGACGGDSGGGDTGSGTIADEYNLVGESPKDDYVADPGEQIHKTWTIVNLGDVDWTGYKWEYVYGDQMTSSSTGNLVHLSGKQWQASIDITAPQAPKTYRGYWRLVDSSGNPVNNELNGAPYWVNITVKRVDNLQFISDVNYPPGAHVPVGQSFTKTWKVKNTGNVPWTTSYNFAYVSGDQMKDTSSIAVSAEVSPGSTANLNLGLKAPSRPDTYTGYWRMKDENGNFFGDTLKVQIVTTFTAHVQTTADGSAYNAKARLQKQSGSSWQTVQDWKATPFDVSDLTKGVYRVQYSEENVPAWYQIPADETFNSDNLSGSTKTFTGNYPRVDWYAQFVSQSPSGTATMKAGQMQQFTVTLKNRGAQSWTKVNFHLGLKNAGSSEAGSFFLTKAADGSDSGWLSDNRIHSNETTIGTDQTATFSFWMRAPATAGSYTEHFSLVNDGSGGFWFTDTAPHNNSAHNGPDIVWNITVQPDTPPVLQDQSITVDQDSSVTISLNPAGGNGNPWIVQNSRPRHGTLSEGPDSLSAIYTPDAGYVGQDSFTVRVSDGLLTSNSATISITVKSTATPPPPNPQPGGNSAPEPLNQSLTTPRNRSLNITLSGFDSDGDALTYQVIIVPRQLIRGRWVGGSPAHGTLSGSGANWVYTPDANFRGTDSFQFEVSDGVETSIGTINITVR